MTHTELLSELVNVPYEEFTCDDIYRFRYNTKIGWIEVSPIKTEDWERVVDWAGFEIRAKNWSRLK